MKELYNEWLNIAIRMDELDLNRENLSSEEKKEYDDLKERFGEIQEELDK